MTGGEPCRARTAGGGGDGQLGDLAYLSDSLLLLRDATLRSDVSGSLHKWKRLARR